MLAGGVSRGEALAALHTAQGCLGGGVRLFTAHRPGEAETCLRWHRSSLVAEVGQGARQSGSETSRERVPFTQKGGDAAAPPRALRPRQVSTRGRRPTAHGPQRCRGCVQAGQGAVLQLTVFLTLSVALPQPCPPQCGLEVGGRGGGRGEGQGARPSPHHWDAGTRKGKLGAKAGGRKTALGPPSPCTVHPELWGLRLRSKYPDP